ncbi:hypothetical protein C8Q80DRAFT_1271408 [Daedaleopsis nitida]|nr:hypothetical protein C8Q80DRAFT_1271408 [Daedaleopsis nitida]
MAATARVAPHAPHFFRPHHHSASSHGDASYSSMLLDRSRRAEGHSRKASEVAEWASATTRDREGSTSHFRARQDVQVPPAIPSPLSHSSSSPSSASPSPSPHFSSRLHHAHISPAPSFRAGMNFNNTNATSTWGSSSGASSSASSVSPPASRVRHETRERHPVDAEKIAASEMDTERSAEEESLTIARRGPFVHSAQRASPSPSDERDSSSPREGFPYQQRQHSWSPESLRPTLPSFEQLQLPHPIPIRPVRPEFVQGSSRPSFSGVYVHSHHTHSHYPSHRESTASPPPSPSPSASSYSTNALSGGHTDTEPTDEDEYQFVKDDPESVKLPPLRLPPGWTAPTYGRSHIPSYPVDRSSATSSSSASPCTSPELSFHRRGVHGLNSFPAHISDVRTRIPHRSVELPPPMVASFRPESAESQKPQSHDAMASRGRPVLPQHPRATPSTAIAAPSPPAPMEPLLSPTPKKYRFVASKPQLAVAGHADERASASDPNAALASGTKRRHANASPASSVDSPLAHSSPTDEDGSGPRKRRPYDIGLFPASPSPSSSDVGGGGLHASGTGPGTGRGPRAPRGAIVPAYHYDAERAAHKCAFAACGAVLSGKKAETASHMRAHFVDAAGETLHCPWPVEGDDGARARCAMAFKDSANFGRHVSSKHIKAEEYQCNRCGRPFARRDAALRHMKTLCRVDAPGAALAAARRGAKGGERKRAKGNVENDDDDMYDD